MFCPIGYRHRLRKGLVGLRSDVFEEEWHQHQQKAGYYLQCTDSKGEWKDLYFFHLAECFEKDYAIYNWWCSAAPEAAMMNMKVAAIQSEHGRVTYDGKVFKVFESDETGDHVIENAEAAPLGSEQTDAELRKRFGISFQ